MLNKLSQHLITAHRTLFRNKICLDIMCFALIGLLDGVGVNSQQEVSVYHGKTLSLHYNACLWTFNLFAGCSLLLGASRRENVTPSSLMTVRVDGRTVESTVESS